jgi:hypothetical protein
VPFDTNDDVAIILPPVKVFIVESTERSNDVNKFVVVAFTTTKSETFKEPSSLLGVVAIFVTNLEPRMIKGYESQAMILATGEKDNIVLFRPDKEVKLGQKAR